MNRTPDAKGHFGPYGGRYVPEILIPALDELLTAYQEASVDEQFARTYQDLLRDYVGRPTALTRADRLEQRLSDQAGNGRADRPRIYLKREDLCHTGAHKINNTIGQVLLARRMGKKRIIAETGAGQHGVATATVCAKFGLECIVYMGSEDMSRQRLNVHRMRLLGADVRPAESGSKTLKDATNEAIRDWVTNVRDTFYIIGSVVGPHPYPMMVRDFHRVIGVETRSQLAKAEGRETPDVLETPMEICWQFDYAIGIEKLRELYSKSKRLQWDAERDIDWDLEIDPSRPIIEERRFGYDRIPFMQSLSKTQRETFTAHAGAHRLSQFLHGEQGALMTAAALTHAVPDYEGKLYAATQTMDEARHVEVFERYVTRLACVYPISPALKTLIDATLTAGHWVKIAIGMNMVIEGLALGAFHNMRRFTSCALMRQIVEGVLRDEARHVAFGNLYVAHTIEQMHPDEREDVAEFAFEAIRMMSDSTGGPDGKQRGTPDPGFREVLVKAEIDPGDFVRGVLAAREQGIAVDQQPGTIHSFKDLMMPALVRVGAVTKRSRARYDEAGIPVHEDLAVLEALEAGQAEPASPEPA